MEIPSGFVDKARFVRVIFTDVEKEYNALLHVMTLSFDTIWRRRLLSKMDFSREMMILDLACGTGLVTYALSRRVTPRSLVVGLDLSSPMLTAAKIKKYKTHSGCQVEFVRAVSEFLPFRSQLFSYVTVGLALRNFANKIAMFNESLRVLTWAGWFLSVDFVRLENPWLWLVYKFHLFHTLPAIGRLVSKYWARTLLYLANSILISTPAEQICRVLVQVGFRRTSLERITLGVVALVAGQK
jgi:demethylmenaquinone methyltransferase/2-methoxy-6-polyprenyl-1,4-benzoquinol methylase